MSPAGSIRSRLVHSDIKRCQNGSLASAAFCIFCRRSDAWRDPTAVAKSSIPPARLTFEQSDSSGEALPREQKSSPRIGILAVETEFIHHHYPSASRMQRKEFLRVDALARRVRALRYTAVDWLKKVESLLLRVENYYPLSKYSRT